MKPCPSCQHACSPRAESCPSCGHPIHRGFLGRRGAERALNVTVLVIILAALFVVGLGVIISVAAV